MEGDNRQRRQAARETGASAGDAGVTTGASKQRQHLQGGDDDDRLTNRVRGKQDPEHAGPTPRPGSSS
jgi:hypothetical protein